MVRGLPMKLFCKTNGGAVRVARKRVSASNMVIVFIDILSSVGPFKVCYARRGRIFQIIFERILKPAVKENPAGRVSNAGQGGETGQNGLLALPPLLT